MSSDYIVYNSLRPSKSYGRIIKELPRRERKDIKGGPGGRTRAGGPARCPIPRVVPFCHALPRTDRPTVFLRLQAWAAISNVKTTAPATWTRLIQSAASVAARTIPVQRVRTPNPTSVKNMGRFIKTSRNYSLLSPISMPSRAAEAAGTTRQYPLFTVTVRGLPRALRALAMTVTNRISQLGRRERWKPTYTFSMISRTFVATAPAIPMHRSIPPDER